MIHNLKTQHKAHDIQHINCNPLYFTELSALNNTIQFENYGFKH